MAFWHASRDPGKSGRCSNIWPSKTQLAEYWGNSSVALRKCFSASAILPAASDSQAFPYSFLASVGTASSAAPMVKSCTAFRGVKKQALSLPVFNHSFFAACGCPLILKSRYSHPPWPAPPRRAFVGGTALVRRRPKKPKLPHQRKSGTSGFETTDYRMNKGSIFPWKVELDSGPRVLSYKPSALLCRSLLFDSKTALIIHPSRCSPTMEPVEPNYLICRWTTLGFRRRPRRNRCPLTFIASGSSSHVMVGA
jgi:hypothetical protein